MAKCKLASIRAPISLPACGSNLLNVLGNDVDIDADELSITGVTPTTAGGSVIITQLPPEMVGGPAIPALSYTPPVGFVGLDTFSYTIMDPSGGTSTAMVNVEVLDVPAIVRFRLEVTDAAGSSIT